MKLDLYDQIFQDHIECYIALSDLLACIKHGAKVFAEPQPDYGHMAKLCREMKQTTRASDSAYELRIKQMREALPFLELPGVFSEYKQPAQEEAYEMLKLIKKGYGVVK